MCALLPKVYITCTNYGCHYCISSRIIIIIIILIIIIITIIIIIIITMLFLTIFLYLSCDS